MPEKFDKFDAFSTHDMLYNERNNHFDKAAFDLNIDFTLHSFEDSL